jgi:hypothetical protein
MHENPYAAPKSHVEDAPEPFDNGGFIPDGRHVAAGNGWRWILDAWAFTAEQRGAFIGVFLLYLLVLMALGIVPLIGALASALLTPVITAGLQLGYDTVRRGGRLEVACLFSAFQNHAGKLIAVGAISLGIGILIGIVVVAILGVSFAGILASGSEPTPEDLQAMLLPGALAVLIAIALALPLYMFLWFAAPLIVLGGLDVGAALKTSFGACLKNIVPYLVWSAAVIGLWLVALIPCALVWQMLGVGAAIAAYFLIMIAWAILLGPVLMASVYLSYRDIFYEA